MKKTIHMGCICVVATVAIILALSSVIQSEPNGANPTLSQVNLAPGQSQTFDKMDTPTRVTCDYPEVPVCRVVVIGYRAFLYANDHRIAFSDDQPIVRGSVSVDKHRIIRPSAPRPPLEGNGPQLQQIINLCQNMVQQGLCSRCKLF